MITDIEINQLVGALRQTGAPIPRPVLLTLCYDLVERYLYNVKQITVFIKRPDPTNPFFMEGAQMDLALNSAIKYYTEQGIIK